MSLPTPDTSAWFVATKLHPPVLRSDTIRRPRLEEALRRFTSTLPVTLLSAPAGYGKTTLLAALPHLLPDHPLAWVTLDMEDNDPIRFVGLLTTALQRLHPDCGRSVWPWLSGGSAESSGLKRAISLLINDVITCLPNPFLLVLDDLHFVTEPAVYVALEYLLDHQPPQLHLAMGTRHDPPLRLARLAARGHLAEIRRPDLSFNDIETDALLNEALGLSLTASEVSALQERTEGWPAGLCLLAGPLGRMDADRAQFMATVTHPERYLLDFLAEEVLRGLPDGLRRFLLQTSILAEITPSACRAVTAREDADCALDQLYRHNLAIASFPSEAGGEPVYRYHALLARLLARQLQRELPGEITELHRRAAQVQKTPGRAIAHYVAAGLWEDAAQLMLQFGMELLHRGMSETVRSWYQALPAQVQSDYPRLTLLMGRCEIHRGDYAAAGLLLHQAKAAFVASGDAEGEGEALASLITLANQNDDWATARPLVARALMLPLTPLGQVAARLALAWIHLTDGDWAATQASVCDALAIPQATGDRRADLVGITYMSAPLAAVPGCLDLTERYAAEAGALARPDTAWRLGAVELGAWPLLWRGRTAEALAQAEAAEAIRQRLGGYPFVGSDAAVLLTILCTDQGDLEAAGRATDALLARTEKAARSKQAFYLHAAGRALAWLGRLAEARTVCQRLAALPGDHPLTQYLCGHLTGLLALLGGRLTAATTALERAAGLEVRLPIAWVGGSARLLAARVLLEQGRSEAALATAAPVLRDWEQAATPGCALLDGPVVRPVLELASQRQSSPLAGLAEPLTARECDVLRLLVAGQTNREIAARLFIAEETVKSHVAHILRKLEVDSRTQAALRGRELGF